MLRFVRFEIHDIYAMNDMPIIESRAICIIWPRISKADERSSMIFWHYVYLFNIDNMVSELLMIVLSVEIKIQ